MSLSAAIPIGDLISISIFPAVKSLILRTLSFPFLVASSIELIRDSVVIPGGISEMARVELSFTLIRARIRIVPRPSSYSEASIRPPAMKSGNNLNFWFRSTAICASNNSMKLCGRILDESPTAIPSVPNMSKRGNFDGKVTGSFPRPS
ncbi:MAG: hypothetical protein M2R45_05098 [Verrucomicrobia subdivision 3 bacterium]|nr:hypothetical protein [Limisphaerales bacterium]MCS1417769.1 hypothetical protein [Limisphaerales bacterium]